MVRQFCRQYLFDDFALAKVWNSTITANWPKRFMAFLLKLDFNDNTNAETLPLRDIWNMSSMRTVRTSKLSRKTTSWLEATEQLFQNSELLADGSIHIVGLA